MILCPKCNSYWRQHWQWRPDLEPTQERQQCYVCGWKSGWVEYGYLEATWPCLVRDACLLLNASTAPKESGTTRRKRRSGMAKANSSAGRTNGARRIKRPAPRIIGIDPSSKKLALVSLYDGVVEAKIATLGKKSGPEACGVAMDWLNEYLHLHAEPALAFVESPLVGRAGVRATMVQAFVGGVIQACFASADVPIYVVHASTWKTHLTGKPTASKDDVRAALRTHWPEAFRESGGDPDLIDASGICFYGRHVHHIRKAVAAGAGT